MEDAGLMRLRVTVSQAKHDQTKFSTRKVHIILQDPVANYRPFCKAGTYEPKKADVAHGH